MAVPLHIRVREWFADASGEQLPHIRPVPAYARRSKPPMVSWVHPMPGHMRAAIAVLSGAAAMAALGLLAALLFGAYVLLA